jgi:ribose transport system ATP-binding protein
VADDGAAHPPAQRPDARHRRRHQAGDLRLLRRLAEAGTAILFYSTDYDELVGCCDRVLVMYDGRVRRELVGAEITEHALVSSALNIGDDARRAAATAGP